MRARVFLVFTVIGFFMPLVMTNIYAAKYGWNAGDMLSAMWPNPIALAVLLDLSISSFAFWYWASYEGPRLGIDRWWWVIPFTLIGLCFALPLFMYWRERALESQPA